MEERPQPIIIKKKKSGHGEHHGGAWKVAYADFVTALMAFFLVMWLVSMVAPEKKAAVADYMRNFNLFKESGSSFMDKSSQVLNQSDKGFRISSQELSRGSSGNKGLSSEEMVKKLKKAIEEKLASVKNQVLVDIIEGGVRIQIVDAEGGTMFLSGSADPTEKAKEILKLVSENIQSASNRIAIEGHTDAAPFKNAQTTNWELSTARASAARRELERNGIETSKIARVVGYADQELLVPDNPKDSRNRRISIILLYEKTPETR
jgi:chemotaxis protein MotB